jgi:periplasmic divalent cation tolerance protein
MPADYIIVLVTTPDIETGKRIGRRLVEGRLAACANILPGLTSIYTWDDKVNEDSEVLMLVKTRLRLFERLAEAVKAEHPYDVPEIIALPLEAGSQAYLDWIRDSTQTPA